MNRVLIALLTLAVAATAAPASADHQGRRHAGGCSFTAARTAPVGHSGQWRGEVHILARTTTGAPEQLPTVEPITVECELFVNGTGRGVAVSATGTGVVAHAAELRFTAAHDDAVSMCSWVTVSGHRYLSCPEVGGPPVTEPVEPAVDYVIDLVNHLLGRHEPPPCSVLKPLTGQYGPVLVTDEGDVYLFGDTYDHLWWDCPPYTVPPGGSSSSA